MESQWTGNTKKDIYVIDANTGRQQLVKADLQGIISPSFISPKGSYIVWYDSKARHYFAFDGKTQKNITSSIKTPLYNEEHDSPSDPSPYGIMKWQEDESAVYIYDRYSVWKVDPTGKNAPSLFISGRKEKTRYRYQQLDPEERAISSGQTLVFRTFKEINKQAGIWLFTWVGNQRAIDFYLRCRFKIIGSQKFKVTETHYNQHHQMFLDFE